MSGFFHLARRMFRHWTLLALALVFAMISAGGLGAGLLGIKPVLDNILGSKQSLRELVREKSAALPFDVPDSWIAA
ncbi:MAG TPA: hypothetical protein VD963_06715, partial [Phycisphaerales bacterium]|nr:hypothetical protein [Phycisphaerales bacterium]